MSNLTKSLTSGSKLDSGKSPLREHPEKAVRAIRRLFDRFRELYAVRWTEQDNDVDAWTRELGDFSMAAVTHAVVQAEKRYVEWPPTLAIFKSLCREYVEPLDDRVAALKQLYHDGPKDSEIARRFKPIIAAILGEPGGDEKAMREYLKSPEHAHNVRRMMKPYHGI